MTETALITGATAGIGAEFARQLAAQGVDLVLVARDQDRLTKAAETLSATYGVHCEVLRADLLTEAGVAAVVARLSNADPAITILVNNAGFGLQQPFEVNAVQKESEQLDILVAVPLKLTHAALGALLGKRQGRIINVASVAGFTLRGTYAASKTWLISFSRWANITYKPRGVTVTAVCPGLVRTEFHQRMGMPTARIPRWMWLQPEQVVREALANAEAGRSLSIPSLRYKALTALAQALPARLTAKIASRRTGHD